jgi:phage-related protein
LPKLTQNITNNIKGMGTGVRNGLGHVLKYAGALVSLRSIYSTLSSCAQSWLSSQNAGAKQLSTNIDYMKYAMGSAFAPVIQYVTGLIYQLMKAIQSVVYALFRVNIFAKASASSYANMAGSAKKAKNETKSLSNIHSEINNVQSNDNSDSGSGGSSSPSFDLSGIDNQMSPLAQKLYDFFKPLVDSWNQYGTQVIEAFKNAVGGIGQAISAMWNSVETLFTNGTIYSIIANILNSIGQIGVAWANAWNNDNNGTEIVQGIANMIDDITNAILNLVSSTGFQSFLDGVLSAFSGIVQFIEPIVSGFSEMAEKILEIVLSSIGDVLKTVGDALQTIAQNKTVSEILKAVGGAIAIVVGAIVLWNIAQAILNGLMGLFAILTSPITLIILAVIAAITAIIVVVKNWGTISEWFQNLWVKITEKLQEIWNNIKLFFVNLWNSIIDKIKTVWNGIKDFLSNLWNGILNIVKTVFSAVATFFSNVWNNIRGTALAVWTGIKITISTVITNIKDKISTVLNNIKTVWNNIWTTIGNVVKNIWNGIWSGIKGIINSILGGIEGFVNGTIKGINKLLSGISSVANAVGSLIGLNPISLQISTISLPRLAKGGVLTEATTVLAGEYSGARTNPEIVTPQNIMRDTFEDVLSDFNSGNGQQVHITIQYLGKEIFDDTIDYINSKTRRTGKNTIVTVGD